MISLPVYLQCTDTLCRTRGKKSNNQQHLENLPSAQDSYSSCPNFRSLQLPRPVLSFLRLATVVSCYIFSIHNRPHSAIPKISTEFDGEWRSTPDYLVRVGAVKTCTVAVSPVTRIPPKSLRTLPGIVALDRPLSQHQKQDPCGVIRLVNLASVLKARLKSDELGFIASTAGLQYVGPTHRKGHAAGGGH
jgi:hypothetical protein